MNKEIIKQLIDVLGALSSAISENRLKIAAFEATLKNQAPELYEAFQRQYHSGTESPYTSAQAQLGISLTQLQALFRNEVS